jgi:hypothetical protein
MTTYNQEKPSSPTRIEQLSGRTAFLTAIANKDRDMLWSLISDYFGVQIPRVAVCHDHCAPFDFICDYLFGEIEFAVVMANRSGGKTENFAILDTIISYVYSDTEVATVGAIQFQAQKCYEYFKDFTQKHPFNDNIASSTISKTELKNGSQVQVLTGTMSGVNSPHPQILFVDEIDLMAWPVLQQALSMPMSKNGVSSRTVLTSTRKFASGVMQRLIDDAPKKGYKVYQWCVWEVMEKLPEEPIALDRIKKTFGAELPDRINLVDGYYQWRDAIAKKTSPLEVETWEVEWLCRKAGLEGVIYGSSYDDDNNLLVDWTPQGKAGYLYIFEDFGYGEGHPDVLLPVWIPPAFDRMVIFDERYNTGMGTDDIWQSCSDMLAAYGYALPDPRTGVRGNVRGWIGDPHGFTEIADRIAKGAPMMDKHENAQMYIVNNGIVLVQKLLQSGRLMITDKCVNLRSELMTYKRKKNLDGTYSKEPEKKNDHGPDALRYGVIRLGALIASRILKETMPVAEKPAESKKTIEPTAPLARQYEGRPVTAGMLKEKF